MIDWLVIVSDEEQIYPLGYKLCGRWMTSLEYVSGKRKGSGEENLFERDGRKGGFLTIIGWVD